MSTPGDDRKRDDDRRAFLQRATALNAGAAAASLLNAQSQQPTSTSASTFDGFKISRIQTTGANISVVSGGQGPPVLLLHGSPQTHLRWHKIAPQMAREFNAIAAALRGYGNSSKPAGGENHSNYSKRSMALDQIEVMSHFGASKMGAGVFV